MAIDTAPKRRSVAGIAAHPLGPAVTPDATPGVEWRQQVAWGYSGIAPDAGGGAQSPLLLRLQLEGLFVGSAH